MRLLTINADNGGCGKYRIFEPANAVVAQFPDIFVSHSRMIDISRAATYDAVIIQRPLFQGYAEAIPEMQRRGTKVIIDIDDDLTDVHPENCVYANLQPETSPRSNWEHALKACELADLVICSTDTLASKFKSAHGGSVVINNYLPDSILGIHGKHHAGRIRIGWAGHTQTHPNDLPAVGSSIRNAVRKSKAEFVVLGGGPQVPEQVRLETSQFRTIPSAPITQYYKTIADNFDVGIAPLELTDFNEAKSWLKMLEYAGLGIPAIGSATTENIHLHDAGIGLIAQTHGDWNRAISLMISSDRKREKLGEDSRKIVKEKFTYSKNAWRWAEAWRSVLS